MNNDQKTTALGLGGAVFFAILPVLQKGNFSISTDWPYLVVAAGSAFFGYFTNRPNLKP